MATYIFWLVDSHRVFCRGQPGRESQQADTQNQPLVFTAPDTYSHVVGVDVIGAHDVGIGVFQDDPGVVDFQNERGVHGGGGQMGISRTDQTEMCL